MTSLSQFSRLKARLVATGDILNVLEPVESEAERRRILAAVGFDDLGRLCIEELLDEPDATGKPTDEATQWTRLRTRRNRALTRVFGRSRFRRSCRRAPT